MSIRNVFWTIVRLFTALTLTIGTLAISVGTAAAAPDKPQPKITQVGDEEPSNKSAPAHIEIDGLKFDFYFVLMSGGFPRLVIENVSGDGNVAISGVASSEGYVDIKIDEKVREAKYPGIKLGEFKDLPYDTGKVQFNVSINGNPFPVQSLLHKHGPVHPWASFPQFPKLCKADVGVRDDPGVKVFIDGLLKLAGWYKDTPVTVGSFDFEDGPHSMRVETYKPRNGQEQWEKINQVLEMSWTSVGCSTTPPPALSSAKCDNLTPNAVALKPSEKQTFKLTGTKVVSYSIALDGKTVSTTDSYEFTASDVTTHTIVGKVAGEDGVWQTAKACNATVVVSQTPPVVIPPIDVKVTTCGDLTPHAVVLVPGQDATFTLTGNNVAQYLIKIGETIVSKTSTFIFHATDQNLGTTDLAGYVAGDDGAFVTSANCVARIIVTQNPPPVVQPPAGHSRMDGTTLNILDCRYLDQYGENVYWRGQNLVHISTYNHNPDEKWQGISASWSTDGDNPNSFKDMPGATRSIGLEAKSAPVNLEVAVDWVAEQQSDKVPSTYGNTQPFRGTIPAVDPKNYEQVKKLGFHVINPQNGDLLGPVDDDKSKAGQAYKWSYDVMIAKCSSNPQAPVLISVCMGRNNDGSLITQTFEKGKEPPAAASCTETKEEKDSYCAKVNGVDTNVEIKKGEAIPAHLPCTLGEVDEGQAFEIVREQGINALIAIFFLAILVVLYQAWWNYNLAK